MTCGGRSHRVPFVRVAALALLASMAFLAGSCATPGTRGHTAPLDMEPIHVVAHREPDGRLVTDAFDAATLFARAGDAYEARNHEEAIRLYRLLLSEFPESPHARAARYNLGLALEAAGRRAEAVLEYRTLAAAPASTPKEARDTLDALFRLAECCEVLKDWPAAEETFRRILARGDLSSDDEVEARTRLGDALLQQGRLDEAEETYTGALSCQETVPPRPLLRSTEVLARAQFGLAEVERHRFEAQPIRLPEAVMEADLKEKARLFLRAQAAYFRTMSYPDRAMAVAAGLRIGYLYEVFYDQLMAAPYPPDLTEEERQVYFEELRKTIRPLVERAVYVYQKNLAMSQRLNQNDAWVKETEERLRRLQEFLNSRASWEAPSPPPDGGAGPDADAAARDPAAPDGGEADAGAR